MSDDLQPDLAAALVAFQGDAPTINKTRTALIPTKSGGSYSYKYADLSDIWDAIREPLKDNGLAVTQSLCGSDGLMGIRTTVWHLSGETMSDTVEFAVGNRTPQEIGSQITYIKRYALTSVLGLSTEEDDDGAAASRPPRKSEEQVAQERLLEVCKAMGLDPGTVAARFRDELGVDIRQADAVSIDAFTDTLKAEGVPA